MDEAVEHQFHHQHHPHHQQQHLLHFQLFITQIDYSNYID